MVQCYLCQCNTTVHNSHTLVHHIPIGEDTITENVIFCLPCAKKQLNSTISLFIIQRILMIIALIIINIVFICSTYCRYIDRDTIHTDGLSRGPWQHYSFASFVIMLISIYSIYDSMHWLAPVYESIGEIDQRLTTVITKKHK